MSLPLRVVYCHCAYAKVVPAAVKDEVLRRLTESGVPFDAVPDLCELSARKDPSLAELVTGPAKIAACYPRAVKWLFNAAGSPLPADAEVLNMRTETAEAIAEKMFAINPSPQPPPRNGEGALLPPPGRGEGGGGGRSGGEASTPHPNPPPQGGRGPESDGFSSPLRFGEGPGEGLPFDGGPTA